MQDSSLQKDNGNPTIKLTTSFMNLLVIEIHVLPRQNFELVILLPSRQK